MHATPGARIAAPLLGLLLAACPAPVATTVVAAGVAAHRVERGGCPAACTPGYTCSPKSHLCEPVPCARGCPAGQSCVQTSRGARCQPSDLELHRVEGASQPGGAP